MGKPLLPDVWTSIQDGALGILPPPSEGVSAKVGVSTKGPLGKVLAFTNIKQVRETLGGGPLAEAIATHLALSGAPVYAVRAQGDVTAQSFLMGGIRQGTGEVRLTAQNNDAVPVTVVIKESSPLSGGLGGSFVYSTNGGETFSAPIAIPPDGVFSIEDEGIILEFVSAGPGTAFVSGDRFDYAPPVSGYGLPELVEALDVLLNSPLDFGWVHVVGSAYPAVAAAVATKMREAESRHRYAFALLEEWSDSPDESWDAFADTRVAVAVGTATITSPMTGRTMPRSIAWLVSGRLASIPPHEHLGRVASGPVPGIIELSHDEGVAPLLDGRRFITARTIIGRRGFYFTRGRIMAPEGSDYQFIENRRVMDLACRIARNAALNFINESVRVDGAGNITESDARAIEAYVEGALIAGLISPGYASAAQVRLQRDSNVLSTRSTTMTIRVRPRGYLEYIELDLSFDNPALRSRGTGSGSAAVVG